MHMIATSAALEPRKTLRARHRTSERAALEALAPWFPDAERRRAAVAQGAAWVRAVRDEARPGLMEMFLAEYELSTDEGVALMSLAEALLRTTDPSTADALIADKIAPAAWLEHAGASRSTLVNAATLGLSVTAGVLDAPENGLSGAVKRLGAPVIRMAVRRAMREMGRTFVLGRDIAEAMARAAREEATGVQFSYDMLGEAAMTAADAARYAAAYEGALAAIAREARSVDTRENPGLSIKLSALHPRYEEPQRDRVIAELVPRVAALAQQARAANLGLNIDAEEADRLELSLDVIEAVVSDPGLAGWDGFGVVVQAYGKRAGAVIDWLSALAERLDRRFAVRLVKGAYWDAEIKRAQVDGVSDYPVYTRKAATDASYIACAAKLFAAPRLYPQFATHNAHTAAAVLGMAPSREAFEFQRLHGMGEALHARIRAEAGARLRVYAPVGAHRELLAYLVRRLLENGANASFVNQVLDPDTPAETVAADPFDAPPANEAAQIAPPAALFGASRVNSRGWDLRDPGDIAAFEAAREPYRTSQWRAAPLLADAASDPEGAVREIRNPARLSDLVGHVTETTPRELRAAIAAAAPFAAAADARGDMLRRAADLYEASAGEVFALLAREAGKTGPDAVAELREAVDFLRYYAVEGARDGVGPPRGLIACVSPWNFPLAIFTGQIAAALAAGDAVIAKPAEQTPLIGALAVRLLHEAGAPRTALQFAPGTGAQIGAALVSAPEIAGVAFTGSTETAQRIHRALAENAAPDAAFIAETGGVNAMVVDGTALPEQAVRDVIASAFQSAGQRCSALRVLYVQEDLAERLEEMLIGAIDALVVADPWALSSDVGPVISTQAQSEIRDYIAAARAQNRVLHQVKTPEGALFAPPTVIRVTGIEAVTREVFGPVLHIARYAPGRLDAVLAAVNASGYGLTFGLHSRIDATAERAAAALRVGNLYVNRNQIGAVVGSQPFGGEGLSGTGPKAGGPRYLNAFTRPPAARSGAPIGTGPTVDAAAAQALVDACPRPASAARETRLFPGPTGELNRWSLHPRGLVLCLGPSAAEAAEQAAAAESVGCAAVRIAPGASGPTALDGVLERDALRALRGVDVVALWGEASDQRAARRALAARSGPITPLVVDRGVAERAVLERHLCVDVAAAGGDVALLSGGARASGPASR